MAVFRVGRGVNCKTVLIHKCTINNSMVYKRNTLVCIYKLYKSKQRLFVLCFTDNIKCKFVF